MGIGIQQRIMLFSIILITSQKLYLEYFEKQNTLMYGSFKLIHPNGILTGVINSLVKHAHYTK